MANNLLEILQQDCENWISSYSALFMNECEMQLKLSNYLAARQDHYDKVHVEYAVPLRFWDSMPNGTSKHSLKEKLGLKANENMEEDDVEESTEADSSKKARNPKDPLDANMYIDIVVERAGKFAAVELKYATTPIDKKLFVFQEKKEVDVIKNTGGQNNKRYDYWYDVCRIEALTRFPHVVGGITLMVTNDSAYWTTPKEDEEPDYVAFSMRDGHKRKPGELDWKTQSKSQGKKTRPAFRLDDSYPCKWEDTPIPVRAIKGNVPFRFLMHTISK